MQSLQKCFQRFLALSRFCVDSAQIDIELRVVSRFQERSPTEIDGVLKILFAKSHNKSVLRQEQRVLGIGSYCLAKGV